MLTRIGVDSNVVVSRRLPRCGKGSGRSVSQACRACAESRATIRRRAGKKLDGAAQESNLPSVGLRRRTGFEDKLAVAVDSRYLEMHQTEPVTMAKLGWLLGKATAPLGEVRLAELTPKDVYACA
jgi:hypothetical protein